MSFPRSLARYATVAGLAVVIFGLAVYPFRNLVLGFSPGFFVGYGILTAGSELLLGMLLVRWARDVRSRTLAWLGATYVATGTLVAGNAAVLYAIHLGAHIPLNVSGWFWIFFHLTWPAGVLLATIRPLAERASPFAFAAGAFLVVTLVLATSASSTPGLLVTAHGFFTPLDHALTQLGIALSLVAAQRIWRRGAVFAAEIDGWLMVAAIALIGDMLLGELSNVRLTVAAYAGRLLSCLGALVVFVGLLREFSRRVVHSAALERDAGMIDALPVIAFITDSRLRCEYVNPRWSIFTGQTVQEARGTGWQRCLDIDGLAEQLPLAGANGELIEREIRLRDRDGVFRLHLARFVPYPVPAGEPPLWVGTASNIDGERKLTEALRSVFLPSYLPRIAGLVFDAVYLPLSGRHDVGGDWYDAFLLPNGRLAFTIGDVSGHGLEAATEMVRVRETLRASAVTAASSPSQSLATANRVIASTLDSIASAVVAFYDPQRSLVTISSAGHPSPILIRDGVATLTAPSGLVLGADERAHYTDHVIRLLPGDRLAFCTDGVLEANREPIEGEQRLLRALELLDGRPLEEVVTSLFDSGQSDDATLVVASYSGEGEKSWYFHADDAGSAQSARPSLRNHLRARGFGEDLVSRAELVFGELVGNVVRHAPGPIDVALSFSAGAPVLSVRDRGPGFAPRAGGLPADPYAESGRGLFLVNAFAGCSPVVRARLRGGADVRVQIRVEAEVVAR